LFIYLTTKDSKVTDVSKHNTMHLTQKTWTQLYAISIKTNLTRGPSSG